MSQQNLNENFIIDENNNNLENENENENNSFEDIGNILNQNGQENDYIEIIKEKENGNLGKELNNYEIGFLKLGLENAKSDGMSHQGRSDYTIMVDFENYNDYNGNDYEIIPYGLTMDIPEFRSSCRINHYNCNEFSCHTCDKPRGVDYLLKEGNYRNQKDIIDFHNSKPNKQDFLNPQNKILKFTAMKITPLKQL
ncbi:hypothetical protein ACTFIT_005010 [Dictyostelium discoideum]